MRSVLGMRPRREDQHAVDNHRDCGCRIDTDSLSVGPIPDRNEIRGQISSWKIQRSALLTKCVSSTELTRDLPQGITKVASSCQCRKRSLD